MPNQRKKGKKHAGSWLEDQIFAALQERAEQAGVSISDMMKRYVDLHRATARKGSGWPMTKNKAGTRKRFVGVNFDIDVYETLRERAVKEGRSISNMIAFFVARGVSTAERSEWQDGKSGLSGKTARAV